MSHAVNALKEDSSLLSLKRKSLHLIGLSNSLLTKRCVKSLWHVLFLINVAYKHHKEQDKPPQFIPLSTIDNKVSFPCNATGKNSMRFKIAGNIQEGDVIVQLAIMVPDTTLYTCGNINMTIKGFSMINIIIEFLTVPLIVNFIALAFGVYLLISKSNGKKKEDEEGDKEEEKGITTEREETKKTAQDDDLVQEKSGRPSKPLEPEESLGDDPALQSEVQTLVHAAAHQDASVSTKHVFAAVIEKVLMDSIKKVVKSNQAESASKFRTLRADGKFAWVNTHFIFAIDCSRSMKGVRWESVMIGFETFLRKVKDMQEIVLSTYTFDTKVNPCYKEITINEAIEHPSEITFTAGGTNYKKSLEYTIELLEKTLRPDYLACIIFLSDGLGGYPGEGIAKLKKMREEGRKILFYTIGCATEDDADMITMATELSGEHYNVVNAEASRLVFSAILKV